MTATDYIVIALMLAALYRGWEKGFLHAIIGPLALAAAILVSILYLDVTDNIVGCFLILGVGTTVLIIIARLLLLWGRASIQKNYRDYVFIGSRILGSIVNLIWKTALILLAVMALSVVSPNILHTDTIQNNILASRTYALTTEEIINRTKFSHNILMALEVFKDEVLLEEITSSQEYKEFVSNEKIIAVLDDQLIKEQLERKDFLQLVTNPKIWNIIEDDALMSKLTRIGTRVYYAQMGDEDYAEDY